MVSMPRCGCQGKPARYSSGRSLRKSSSSRNGSNSLVPPKPKARRRCTPAPSIVGFDETILFTGRMDMTLILGGDGTDLLLRKVVNRNAIARRHTVDTRLSDPVPSERQVGFPL